MIGTMMKAYSYVKAPRLTFAVEHPAKAMKLAKLRWDLKHAYAPRLAAAGTALLALPAGYAVARARRGAHTAARGAGWSLLALPVGYLIGRAAASKRETRRDDRQSGPARRAGPGDVTHADQTLPREPVGVHGDGSRPHPAFARR